MSNAKHKYLLAGGALAALLCAGAVVAAAAPADAPAIPDFSSNSAAWQAPNGTDFIPVPGSPPPVTNDPKYPYVSNGEANRTGKQPTFRIGDLSNPNLKQWAKDIMKKDNDEVVAGKIAFTPSSSCKQYGPTAYNLAGGPFFIIQTPKIVWMIQETERFARRVYMDVPHSKNLKPSWYGESVGHYEGDTLVIDTIDLNTQTFVDNFRTPHSEKLHVVERLRVVNEGKTLEVHMTIDDPETYHQPWQVIRRFNRTEARMIEEICQEGNFMLFDYGIPVAEKPDF